MAAFNQAIISMEKALEAEAQALLKGTLHHLPHIENIKLKAWKALQAKHFANGPSDLSRIKELALRNARLLLAAKEGIDLANTLRSALKKGPKPLSTYGANGRRTTIKTERPARVNSKSF